jgi:hypothetical protein
VLALHDSGGYLAFDEQECRAAGQPLRERYRGARPFPHIVLDDFLSPDLLKRVLESFPSNEGKKFFDRNQERLKFQFQPHETDSGLVRNLFAELNGAAFLGFLEEMTGIEGLIADPWFEGGGLHETKRGGHLGVHADFNVHGRLKAQRRINLLIYLNDDWEDDYGGQLELWDRQMTECVVRVKPLLGRAVIFNTDLDSFHGHPDPLTCPADRSRRSIATYYYSAPEEGIASLPKRTTNFQVRPGSNDDVDHAIRRYHFINDWVPPKLQRIARRLTRTNF